MKKHSLKNLFTYSALGLALAFAATIASTTGAFAAEPKQGSMMNQDRNAERRMAMQEHHDIMLSEMKAQDAELATQIATIKDAPESEKLELVIALLSDMIDQRAAMHKNMAEMMTNRTDNMSLSNRINYDDDAEKPKTKASQKPANKKSN